MNCPLDQRVAGFGATGLLLTKPMKNVEFFKKPAVPQITAFPTNPPTKEPKMAKQTSDKMSSLAAQILSGAKKPTEKDIKALAACVLSQDEKKGKRGK